MQNFFIQTLLTPFAALYTVVLVFRKFLYKINFFKSEQASLPTFCVGNVVLGGSGKTPFTSYLTQTLKELGFKPAILLRGYKGKIKGPKLVSIEDNLEDVGDEAILHLQNNVPVVIAKKRAAGVKFIHSQNLANCIVMDDGLQHFALRAHHNFLLLDTSDQSAIKKWLFGKVIPAGFLREPLNWAAKRADSVILVNKLSDQYPEVKFRKSFHFRLTATDLIDVYTNKPSKLSGDCNILCAIANPENFAKTVENLGLKINDKFFFADHQQITAADWGRIKLKLPLIITSKDAVKIKKFVNQENQVFVLEQTGSICEASKLKNLLTDTLNGK